MAIPNLEKTDWSHIRQVSDHNKQLLGGLSGTGDIISSVVGYRMVVTIDRQQADKNKRIVSIESKKDKWINRIQKYSLYDLVALVFVSAIILKETVITNLYSLEYPYLVIYPVIIIVGLGWGLLSQIVYYQIIYRTRRRNT